MRARDIPDYIFRGSILSVDGQERVLKDFSLRVPEAPAQAPPPGRYRAPKKVLVLEFRDMAPMEYDPARVREIPGKMPEFIREGRKIFCRDPENSENRFARALNGEWEILSAYFEKENGVDLRLRLALQRGQGTKHIVISRIFNSRTMTPSPADERALVEAQKDVTANRPYVLKPRKLKNHRG
jgi:hypothetical protein